MGWSDVELYNFNVLMFHYTCMFVVCKDLLQSCESGISVVVSE